MQAFDPHVAIRPSVEHPAAPRSPPALPTIGEHRDASLTPSELEEYQHMLSSPSVVNISKTIPYPVNKDNTRMVNVRLEMTLRVCRDNDFESRVVSEATFFLTLPDQTTKKRELVTTVLFSLFSRPSACRSEDNDALSQWAKEWITGKMSQARYADGATKEQVWALRSLYNKDGTVKKSVKSGQLPEFLNNPQEEDTVAYISKIMTEAPFAGKGLLKHVIELLLQGVTHSELPDWSRVWGPVCWILEPGFIPDDNTNAVWPLLGDETADDRNWRVTTVLKNNIYPRVGFEVYRIDVPGGKDMIHTYMGRRVFAHRPEEGTMVGEIMPLDSKSTGSASGSNSEETSISSQKKGLTRKDNISLKDKEPKMSLKPKLRPANRPLAQSRRHRRPCHKPEPQPARQAPVATPFTRQPDFDPNDDHNTVHLMETFVNLWDSVREAYAVLSNHDWTWLYESIMEVDNFGWSRSVPRSATRTKKAEDVLRLFEADLDIMPDGPHRYMLLSNIAELNAKRPLIRTPAAAAPRPPLEVNAAPVRNYTAESLKKKASDQDDNGDDGLDKEPIAPKRKRAVPRGRGCRSKFIIDKDDDEESDEDYRDDDNNDKDNEDEDYKDDNNDEGLKHAKKRQKQDDAPFAAKRPLRSNYQPVLNIATKWGQKDLSVWNNKL